MIDQTTSFFDNYSINGLDRISIPAHASRALRKKMLNLYVPIRFRAKLVWNFIQFSDPVAKILNFSRQTTGPSPRLECFDWERWTSKIIQILGNERLIPAFYFPPQSDRKKCSALLFDSEGKSTAYAKLAWGREEIEQARNEREAYRFLNRNRYRFVDTPKLILAGEFDNRYFILLSAFPPDIKLAPKQWNEVYHLGWEEFSTSTAQKIPLINLSWWDRRRNLNDTWKKAFEIIERNEPLDGYPFCMAHGDFSIWNARVIVDHLFLFDWEISEKDAPVFLDPFYFFLSREVLLKKESDPSSIINSMLSEFGSISKEFPQLPDLLLVLIYLKIHTRGMKMERELEEIVITLLKDENPAYS